MAGRDVQRLRQLARGGDLDAAARLFESGLRRRDRGDRVCALDALLRSGRWRVDAGTANRRARRRPVHEHQAVAGPSLAACVAGRAGGSHGGIAAALAVATLGEWLHEPTLADLELPRSGGHGGVPLERAYQAALDAVEVCPVVDDATLEDAIGTIHARIEAVNTSLGRHALEAQLDAVHIDAGWLRVAHVGTGAVLRVSTSGGVERLTQSQDIAWRFRLAGDAAGAAALEAIGWAGQWSVRALGQVARWLDNGVERREVPEPQVCASTLRLGEVLVVVSGGVARTVEDGELAAVVEKSEHARQVAEALVSLAAERDEGHLSVAVTWMTDASTH